MRASLVMFAPDGKRRDFDLKAGKRYTIGRKDSCDLRIPLTSVSREHAVVYFDEEDREFVIEDLDSSNGTYVNGEKITISGLCPGDVVLVGPIPLQAVINGHPAIVKPLKIADNGRASRSSDRDDDESDDNDNEVTARPTSAGIPTSVVETPEPDSVDLSDELMADAEKAKVDMPDESDSFFAIKVDDE